MQEGYGEWVDVLTGTTTTSRTYTEALPRHTYAWRVRARDEAGNVGSYTSGTQLTLYATDFVYLPCILR